VCCVPDSQEEDWTSRESGIVNGREFGHYASNIVYELYFCVNGYGAMTSISFSSSLGTMVASNFLVIGLAISCPLSPFPHPLCITTKLLLLPLWQWPICRVLDAVFVQMTPPPTSSTGLRGNLPSLSSFLLKGAGGICFQLR